MEMLYEIFSGLFSLVFVASNQESLNVSYLVFIE